MKDNSNRIKLKFLILLVLFFVGFLGSFNYAQGATAVLDVTTIGTGSGRVSSSPGRISCPGSACSASFTLGTNVGLIMTPDAGSYYAANAGWNFTGCSGVTSGEVTTITCPFDFARSVTVRFTHYPVDCVGSWSNNSTCSVSCGGGVLQQVYTITTAAAYGGTACPYANGATQWGSTACNTTACPCTGTPWGTVASGYSNTAYVASTADTCSSETRTCTNGTMSGTYTATSCSVNSYSVTFNSAGGSAVTTITQTYGTTITPPADPTRTGYSFTGWSPSLAATMPSGGQALTATWTANSYAISYTATNGSVTPAICTYGATITPVCTPNTGYSTSSCPAAFTCSTSNSQTATFSINSYTVTFDGNTSTGGTTAAQSLVYNTPTALTSNGFTKTGYTFAGWATTAGGTVAYTNGASYTIGAAGVTLYAKWTVNSYTLTITANNGVIAGTPRTTTGAVDYGTAVALTQTPPSGYTFAGWSGACTGTGGCNFTMGAGASSVTASYGIFGVCGATHYTCSSGTATNMVEGTTAYTWSCTGAATDYTVTFDGNTSTGGTTAAQTLAYNIPTALTSNGFTKTGYTFAGWATTAGGTVAYADGASYTIGLAGVTLYAKWTVNNYTVTFDGNTSTGGTTAAQSLVYNTPTTLTSNGFTKTGNTFAGWATTAGGTVAYANGASYTIGAAGVTLYAKWTVNNYTVTFDGNTSTGGTTAAQSLVYNTPTALTSNGFTKTDYNFAGWATTAGGAVAYADGASYTIGAAGVTLYAKWTVVSLFATGGTVTTSGGYTIHTFTTDGTFTPTGSGTVEYLIVGGGGGGAGTRLGYAQTGSGGGGGVLTDSAYVVSAGNYTVTVGAAGASGANVQNGGVGGNSVFGSITAYGGGYGGLTTGGNGGSGGGGPSGAGTGTVGPPRQGYNGGSGEQGAGGGAGAAASGSTPGTGITWNGVCYAGGGGGADQTCGRGRWGGAAYGAAGSGLANRGGGGGAGYSQNPPDTYAGGAGGSGVVIIRYQTPTLDAPTSLSATAISTSQIDLSWTNTDATATTRIYRGGALITTVAAGLTTYSNTGLSAGTSYSYTVRHYKGSTESSDSNTATTSTALAPILNYSGVASGSQDLSSGPLTLTTTGTYTITPNQSMNVVVQCWGAGGGGGAVGQSPTYVSGGGGGGGGFAVNTFSLSATGYTAVVGAAGAGGTWTEANESLTYSGTGGGASSFSTMIAYGGSGGIKGGSGGAGSAGGGYTGASGGFSGGTGGNGITWNGSAGGAGGGGGGAGSTGVGGTGGNGTTVSIYGAAGGTAGAGGGGAGGNGQYNGTAGSVPGGGGGGGNPASGSAVHATIGANGKCIFTAP